MKVKVYNLEGKEVKSIDLPGIELEDVEEGYRMDLIKRAFLAYMSKIRQPYGADPMAGKRTSASYRGRRWDYGSWANRGLHRTKRIRVGSGHMTGVARFVPHAVKGRRAHPPKAEKIWEQKINNKEKRKAIIHALLGTFSKLLTSLRGHKTESIKSLPIIITDDFSKLSKTKDVINVLKKLGMEEELKRCEEVKIRAGKGKMRGRRYKKKVGPLIIVDKKDAKIFKSASNIPGVDVRSVDEINIKDLSPAGNYPRLTIYTESAFNIIKEKLLAQ